MKYGMSEQADLQWHELRKSKIILWIVNPIKDSGTCNLSEIIGNF